MDMIRLFYNSLDVQPGVLLRHFLRYLGFYVDERTDKKWVRHWKSAVDIYIISDEYMSNRETVFDEVDLEKTIYVLKDGWVIDNQISNVVYYDEAAQDEFLPKITDVLCDIIDECQIGVALLLQSDFKWREIISVIVKAYQSNNLLEASLIARCFYRQRNLFQKARKHYERFLTKIEYEMGSDLLRYVSLYAKYELNVGCKKNFLKYAYSPYELLDECEELLNSYEENEELYLLKADIKFELLEDWLDACDEYGDEHIESCAYSNYKRGKIFRSYLKEYENAQICLCRAVRRKRDYCYAWYQLGESYEEQAKYEKSIEAYLKIYEILEEKLERHLLAPLELEYMYKAMLKVAAIYKTRMNDYGSAYYYNELAKEIQQACAFDNYLKSILGQEENEEILKMLPDINDTVMDQIHVRLEEIY